MLGHNKLIARFSSPPPPPPYNPPASEILLLSLFFLSIPVLCPKSRYLVETSVILQLWQDTCFCALKYYFAEALVTNPKLLEKLLSFSQCKMVFIILKIVSNLTILKDWFGCKYNNTNNLLELYNDFSSGAIDKGALTAQSPRICASARRSKTDLTKCDPTAGIGDIVSFLSCLSLISIY